MLCRTRIDREDVPHGHHSKADLPCSDPTVGTVWSTTALSICADLITGSSTSSILSDLPSTPTSVDLRPSSTSQASTARPRKAGKLLSSTQGVGLAMLRLDDHLGAAINGDEGYSYDLELVGQSDSASAEKWKVTPWRPEFWPLFRAQS